MTRTTQVFKYQYGGDVPLRERVNVQEVHQENGELWIRISASNAPRGVPPRICILPETAIIIEETPIG